jgi:hypothetical protein
MIELTEQQARTLENADAGPLRVVNPLTQQTFVLLQLDEYERLKEQQYDDSPWSRQDLETLAWEAAENTGWDEYDDAPERS